MELSLKPVTSDPTSRQLVSQLNERIKHGKIIFNYHNNIIPSIIQMKILRLNNRPIVLLQAGIKDQVCYANSTVIPHYTKVF